MPNVPHVRGAAARVKTAARKAKRLRQSAHVFTSEKNRRLACKLCNLNAAAFEEQISKLSKESDVPQKELASGNPHKMKRRMEKIMKKKNKKRRRNTRNKWIVGGRGQQRKENEGNRDKS